MTCKWTLCLRCSLENEKNLKLVFNISTTQVPVICALINYCKLIFELNVFNIINSAHAFPVFNTVLVNDWHFSADSEIHVRAYFLTNICNIHTLMVTDIHTHTHTHGHNLKHKCILTQALIIYTHRYTDTRTHTHTSKHTNADTHVHAYICTPTHTYTPTHVHATPHTHTHTCCHGQHRSRSKDINISERKANSFRSFTYMSFPFHGEQLFDW